MKLYNTCLAGVIGMVAFTACTSENLESKFNKDEVYGIMQVNVDVSKPQSTKATTEVTNFPVLIFDAEGNTVESYNTVAEVPESIKLGVGNYVVRSHTPGTIEKKMSEPYYLGDKDVEIIKDVTSEVEVICKMKNSIITVGYDDEFAEVFSSWEIIVSDGSETTLSFTNNSTSSVYWYFGEDGVKELTVNFRGTTSEGSIITTRYVLTKDQASEGYDDDSENFGGGNAIKINVKPTESTEGNVTNIAINADVTFPETNEKVNVDVVDVPIFKPDSGSDTDPDNPDTGDEAITLTLPADIAFPYMGASGVDKSLGDTYIAATAGLKSIKVSIESTSEDMVSSLNDLTSQYGVDFVNGAEIVGNQSVVALFNDLGQSLSVPAEGDKEYTFPIGNFFDFLQVLQGEHTFNLTVTDMNGETKGGKLKITIQ